MNDFEIRVGTILQVLEFPEAHKPAYKLLIDFGPMGHKSSSAQITTNYEPEELVGRQVLAWVNCEPKRIGPFLSECLTLGANDEKGHVVLVTPITPVPNGSRLY